MKNLLRLSFLSLIGGALFLTSCKDDEGSIITDPSLTETAPTITLGTGGSVTGDATLTAPPFTVGLNAVYGTGNITSLTVKRDDEVLSATNLQYKTAGTTDLYTTFNANPLTIAGDAVTGFDWLVNVSPQSIADGATYVYKFIVEDENGLMDSTSVTISYDLSTPLTTTPTSFFRCGATSTSPDLATFGLTWATNTATQAIITTSTAVKLVKLTAAQWTTITTAEELATAVDAATSLGTTGYRGISVSTDVPNVDGEVIATKNGNNYYMIKINSSDVTTAQPCGTRIDVLGEYKN